MPAALTLHKSFACKYKGCYKSFDTEKDLRKHKIRQDDHDYCEKCNLDFPDWEALITHRKLTPGTHTACKICGEEFKSAGGRDRHYNQCHQAEQDLACPGCPQRFPRAGGLIAHLEKGHCPSMSTGEFNKYIQHSNIIVAALQSPQGADERTETQSSLNDDGEGGVKLLGPLHEEDQPHSLIAPLSPEAGIPIYSVTQAPREKYVTQWPAPGGKEPSVGSQSSGNQSPSNTNDALAKQMAQLAVKHNVWPRPGEAASGPVIGAWGPSAESSTATKLFPKLGPRSTTTAASSAPTATATVTDNKGSRFATALKQMDEQYEIDVQRQNEENMFRYRFWDPSSPHFNANRFYTRIGTFDSYACPFPGCDRIFPTETEITSHLSSPTHALTGRVNCPSCLKEFKSTTALIQHCESTSTRCRIKKWNNFGQAIHEMSGGFLTARPRIEIRKDEKGEDKEVEIEGSWDYDAEAPRGVGVKRVVMPGGVDEGSVRLAGIW